MGYNRRFKSWKIDIGSKELARDTIHNKGGYLVVRFQQIKNKLPQSYYLNAYAKCDLEWESKQVLKKWCQGRVTYERNMRQKWWIAFKSSKSHGTSTKVKASSLVNLHQKSCKDSWGKSTRIQPVVKTWRSFQKLICKHVMHNSGESKDQIEQ